jgi:hypothetical protein
MAQRTIAAFFQSRPPPREALGDATNATAFSDVSRKSNNDDVARTTTTPPPKRARVAAPLPFAKGADVMDVRGASSRALGAQFCNVDGREILLCGDAWGTEDLTRPISKRWREPDESSRLTVNENRAPTDVRASPSGSAATACDDAVTARVGDVVIRGTNGLVARADGAVIRVYDASNAGAPPVASLCLAHDSVSSDASTCECTRRATRLDARAVTRMTSHRLDAESDTPETSETSEEESLFLRANLAATTAGGELVALAVRREKPERVVATLLGRALLTEGTFQHAFPDLDGSLSLESRLGPFCMWRPKEKNAADADGQRSGTIARFAVAASATGALCFITLAKTKPGDASYSEPLASRRAVATLDRVVSPHLPSSSVCFERNFAGTSALGDPRRRDLDAETRRSARVRARVSFSSFVAARRGGERGRRRRVGDHALRRRRRRARHGVARRSRPSLDEKENGAQKLLRQWRRVRFCRRVRPLLHGGDDVGGGARRDGVAAGRRDGDSKSAPRRFGIGRREPSFARLGPRDRHARTADSGELRRR